MNDVLDARFVREAIEVAIVLEASTKAVPEAIGNLRNIIEQQIEVQHGHSEEFFALDEEFHRTLALSVGRSHAWRVIESIKAQMDRIRYLSLDDATPTPLLIEQHKRIGRWYRSRRSHGGRGGNPHSPSADHDFTAEYCRKFPEMFEPEK